MEAAGEEGEAFRLWAMRAVKALREGEADEAVGAVLAICSSVIALLGVSSAIVGYVDVALEIEM